MQKLQYKMDVSPGKRAIYGFVSVLGMMIAMVFGAVITQYAINFASANFVAFAAGIYGSAYLYVLAWNRYSPWSKTNAAKQ